MNEVCQREFARRENCSPKLVRNRLERGHPKADPEGTIDPALAGTGWRKANAERIAKAQATVAKAPTIPPRRERGAKRVTHCRTQTLGTGRGQSQTFTSR